MQNSTPTELADKLERIAIEVRAALAKIDDPYSVDVPLFGDWLNRLLGLSVELRSLEAPQSVNAELLAVLKYALPGLRHVPCCMTINPTSEWAENGSWSADNCACVIAKVKSAITRAESVDKAPAPVNAQMLDALQLAQVFIGPDEPIISARIADAVTASESAPLQPDVKGLLELAKEIEMHCPCGARPESLNTHSHVIGCPVEKLVRALEAQSKAGGSSCS